MRLLVGAIAVGAIASNVNAVTAEQSSLPLALRNVDPRRLSSGLFAALDAENAFGGTRLTPRAATGTTVDLSKGKPPLVLDPRVGLNFRLGDDPTALPSTQRGQAEPFLYRSAANPAVLLATFQEGRYTDAGSLDCGYSVSTDGGLTWTRSLIPQLTPASGGTYNRATDPVAAIGPQGEMYLNTLASTSGAFTTAAVIVSRSTDNGNTWSAPLVAYQSTTAQVSPDKDWIAVNDYAGTANAGRVVVTWTNFTSTATGTATGDNILCALSDDRGQTWTSPIAVTPTGATNQGSQPAFLPDGSLLIAYVTFPDTLSTTPFSINCKRSTDGGRTYPATDTTIVASVAEWDDPDLREGSFLPSVAVARQAGTVFLTYTGVINGVPRVLVTKSTNSGATWATPIIVSDDPAGVSVMNPAVAVSADGQTVSVVFMDRRNSTAALPVIDLYAAVSTDGGGTWQPNVRLTEMSSDIRYAPPTTRGYMLGDYLGLAPPVTNQHPFVAIWCDTRTGDSDPFTVRLAAGLSGYAGWALARAVQNSDAFGDDDNDGEQNYLEYLDGTDPSRAESGENLVVHRVNPTTVDVDWVERANPQLLNATDGIAATSATTYASDGFAQASVTPANLSADQLPSVPLAPGLVWRGARISVPAGEAEAIARGILPGALGLASSRLVATNGTDARLINVSTRGVVDGSTGPMIVGFAVDGQKNILVRAAGPALAPFGVTDPLPTPELSLTTLSGTSIASASSAAAQQNAAVAVRVGAFAFPPGGTDVAAVLPLSSGTYTGIVSDLNRASGTVLVEAYDADASPGSPSGPRLYNLSTRGNVGPGSDNPLIAGFVITGTHPRRILIRAVGPSLAGLGVSNPLSDPMLTIYQNSVAIASNDDWQISRSGPAVAATSLRLGAFALNDASLDAAILLTLPPGAYSAIVTGVNGAAGTALVEVYDAD